MLILTWLPGIISAILLIAARRGGELEGLPWLAAVAWYLVALYSQFLGGSLASAAIGLTMQSALGVFLLIRLRMYT